MKRMPMKGNGLNNINLNTKLSIVVLYDMMAINLMVRCYVCRRCDEELRMIELRQNSSIESLKSLHKEEIQSIKEVS